MDKKYTKNQIVELYVEKMSFGGAGIARLEDLVVFVQNAAPMERLKARITKVKKRYLEAESLEIIEASPSRRTPACPIALECGGCQWQHIEYAEQLKQKKLIFLESIGKSKIINYAHDISIIPSEEFRYRNRIQIRADKSKIGFYQKATNNIIHTEDCLITEKEITDQFPKLLNKAKSAGKKLKYEIYRDLNNSIQVIENQAHGSAQGFSQVNEKQNKKMIEWLLKNLNSIPKTNIYDFYAGNGNLSIPMAQAFPEYLVNAIELNQNAVDLGNLKPEKPSNLKFICSDISRWLQENKLDPNDSIVIDPPRIGCDEEVIENINLSGIKHLIYISCNPSTWIRDVERLMQLDPNWKIKDLCGLDMFPQTYHLEVLSLISR